MAHTHIGIKSNELEHEHGGTAKDGAKMVMAVACDQTRVFNMFYASAFSATTKPGYDKPHHTATHEEAVALAMPMD